jgi:nucleotidyltransferase substrate binding protein (TIGR01987 family)
MISMEESRWRQRFQNLKNAYAFLSTCIPDAHRDEKSDVALIKAYEMAFELAWKTLQDLMLYQGIRTLGGRDAIKAAFSRGLLPQGHLWIEMLDQRNALVHVYDRAAARAAVAQIRDKYYPALTELIRTLDGIQ